MTARAKTRRGAARRRTARAAPAIAVLVEAPEWRKRVRGVAGLAERAARAAMAAKRVPPRSELCLVLADNTRLRRLNRDWRGKDKPTNVLSFPAGASRPRQPGRNLPTPLGDVIIASGVTASEAKAQGKTLAAHLTHLVVHGVLHLLGYDHVADDEATRMEKLEIRILARLGVANPYRLPETKRVKAS